LEPIPQPLPSAFVPYGGCHELLGQRLWDRLLARSVLRQSRDGVEDAPLCLREFSTLHLGLQFSPKRF